MIRSESFPLPVVRGEPQLRSVYGFAWDAADPANTSLETSIIRAEVEYEDGRTGFFVLRPRAWYGSKLLMTRVWFTCSTGGNMVADVGLTAGDVALPASTSEREDFVTQRYQTAQAQNLTTNPFTADFLRPPGATGLAVASRVPANSQTITAKVFAFDASGVAAASLLTATGTIPIAAVGTLDGRTIDALVLVAGAVFPAAINLDGSPTRGPTVVIPWLPVGGVRVVLVGNQLDAGVAVTLEGRFRR